MGEPEMLCMQRLAREGDQLRSCPAGAASIDRIADQRMSPFREMHANLVGTAGQQTASDQRRFVAERALDL